MRASQKLIHRSTLYTIGILVIYLYTRLEAARCVGALCAYLSDTQLQNTLATHVLDLDGISDWAVLQARAVTISSALLVASSRMVALGLRDVVTRAVICLATSDRIPVCESGLRSVCSFINHIEGTGEEMISSLCQVIKVSLPPPPPPPPPSLRTVPH